MSKVFVGILGVGKGTWGHVARLLSENEFDKVVLIATEWVKENFSPQKDCEWIMINNRAGFDIIKDEMKAKIPTDGDLIVSLVSGSGKEHMALIAAMRELKRDFKLITLTGDGVKYY